MLSDQHGRVLLARRQVKHYARKGKRLMGTGVLRRVGDGTNEVIAEWTAGDDASVAAAREVYDMEAQKGGLMSRCDTGTDMTGEKITAFDPDAEEILAFSRPVGG